ncbi:MAG: flavodoxin family protein [Spirochaetaceae bacterium]|nr:MAG: flavodoxin family protein [Spirochaetaceae bacterium]
MLLAVHSSPKRDGNLERMVVRTAEATGREYRLIRLADFRIAPCVGCVRCAHSKRCVQKDEMAPLYDELESADGLIMGGVNFNGRVNAVAHLFLERLYPLYHRDPAFRDKPAAVVAVGGETPGPAASDIVEYLRDIYYFHVVGTALFTSDNPPCLSCGYGATCPVGIPALYWSPEACEALKRNRNRTSVFRRFEDDPDIVAACERLGTTLLAAIG